MKRLATLFADSYREVKNIRTITVAAMFAAISVALGYFTIQIGDYIKIGFSSISNEFVYYLFGPVVGGCFGGFIDLLKYIIKPTGAFFPGFTVNAILGGILYGMLLYKRPIRLVRVAAAKLTVVVICNILLNTLWLSMLYGKAFMVLLPMRALKNIIMWPIDSLLFYTLARFFENAGLFKTIRRFETGAGMKTADK